MQVVRDFAARMQDSLGLVGTTIAEKYAVESIVGEGGFAVVYRAQHLLWKRPVAVKVFKALGDVAKDQREKLLEDFIQEGRLLADLSERSAAICQARDVGMLSLSGGDQVPYMVLEWLDGKSLDDVLVAERQAGQPPRTLEQAVKMLTPAADALALAHKQGIAHRDIKPANIFVLNGEAGVKLLDFGIAKVVQDAQKMGFGKTAGHITSFTPLYGAPEQFNRAYGATGPWTDVFAFALLVTEVVTGKEPMQGDNLVQLAFTSTNPEARPTPRTLGAHVSDEVEAIFSKAVAVQPTERFQTAGDFWTALHAAVLGDRRSSARFSLPQNVANTGPQMPDNTRTIVDTNPNAAAATAAIATPVLAPPPSKSKAPLVIGVAVVAMLAGVAGVFFTMKAKPAPPPPPSAAPAMTSAPIASASAAPQKLACPPGMVSIPGGDFFMGSDEPTAVDAEKPPHKVHLAPYCLDELEVTVAKYKECSDQGKCRRAGKTNVWPGIKPAQQKIYDPLCNINDPVKKAQHPINCVDWDQAREFCEAQGARLPTEAEWELGARGPDGRIYPWGDEAPSAKLLNACGKECVAWQKAHPDPDVTPRPMYEEDDHFENTAPVGSFPAGKSRYGVQDVVGNVWEWVSDFYAAYDPTLAQKTSDNPTGPASGTTKVIRGGSWNGSQPSWVRPSFRFSVDKGARSYGFGFRCAKTP